MDCSASLTCRGTWPSPYSCKAQQQLHQSYVHKAPERQALQEMEGTGTCLTEALARGPVRDQRLP